MSVLFGLVLLLLPPDVRSALAGSGACRINQVTNNVTSSTALLSWSLVDCASVADRFEAEVQHTAWLACDSKFDSSEEGELRRFYVSEPRLELTRLYPYSTYSLTIRAINNKKGVLVSQQVEVTTDGDVPDTKPGLNLQGGSEIYTHLIRYSWSDPEPEDCRHQNGRRDGYWLELRGLDPWVIQENSIITNESAAGTEYLASNLQPYTSYLLRVFSKNVGGKINLNVFTELHERTRPSAPLPPEDLSSSTISENSIYLAWKPAYPRTGLIEKYILRVGTQNDKEGVLWSKQISVDTGHHNACTSTAHRRDSYVCYVLNNLSPATTYVLEVQTFNKDVEAPSTWSRRSTSETAEYLVPTQTLPDTELVYTVDPGHQHKDGNWTLLIILSLIAGLVVLGTVSIFFIYKFKINKIKERLRLEESIHLSRLDSTYSPGSISTQGTNYSMSPPPNYSLSPPSIQHRRLPEPPPYRAGEQVHLYSEPFNQGYLDMSLGTTAGSRLCDEALVDRVDGEDTDGYLKPTFPHQEGSRLESGSPGVEVGINHIPVESYGVSGQSSRSPQVQGQTGTRPDVIPSGLPDQSSPTSCSSRNKLLISKSVDI